MTVRPGTQALRLELAATLLAAAIAVGGCSGAGQKPATVADPNAYPADYRGQIVAFLRQSLTERADFRGALISPPSLKPIGSGQRYMVCVQFSGHSQLKTKVAIYLEGKMNQFIDATTECIGTAYEPFKDLETALPPQ